MRAARPSERAPSNASAIRSAPAATVSAIELVETRYRLGQILVSAPTETHEVISLRRIRSGSGGFAGQKPRDRVRRLKRRQDALQARKLAERPQRLGIRHRLIAGTPGIAKLRVLRPNPRVVKAGRDGVRL